MGASPMELVLMEVAGCSAIDMISILKNNVKKSRLSKLRLKENAYKLRKPFKNIHVVFYLEGDIGRQSSKSRTTFF
jgi:putative redox protein